MVRAEAFVVVDLAYGDQGKGSVTDFLARDRGAHTVIRYNGGAQAGHNVVTADGRHHTFAQFGAGMFVPGVTTFLSRHVAIQPWAMMVEADYLARAGVTDAFERTQIAEEAPVITPFHRAANRLRERARGGARHGSCGVGVGEAVSDARAFGEDEVVRARDLFEDIALRRKLQRIQERKRAELAEVIASLRGDAEANDDLNCLDDPVITDIYLEHLAPFRRRARLADDRALAEILRRPGAIVFEGAQGVLLDEWHGFHPYTTWSDCTAANAIEILAENRYEGDVIKLGVIRAYATRHGPGPLVTEDAALTARLPDPHNGWNAWQRGFRVGWFDAVTTRYAVRACGGLQALAVTCLDRLQGERPWRIATRYELPDGKRIRDLWPERRRDLDAQAALTARLMTCTPVYEVSLDDGDIDAHLAAIAHETAVPVWLASLGPTAGDKRWLGGAPDRAAGP